MIKHVVDLEFIGLFLNLVDERGEGGLDMDKNKSEKIQASPMTIVLAGQRRKTQNQVFVAFNA